MYKNNNNINNNLQNSRKNLLSYFYFIKQKDQIVNFWSNIYFYFSKCYKVYLLQFIIVFISLQAPFNCSFIQVQLHHHCSSIKLQSYENTLNVLQSLNSKRIMMQNQRNIQYLLYNFYFKNEANIYGYIYYISDQLNYYINVLCLNYPFEMLFNFLIIMDNTIYINISILLSVIICYILRYLPQNDDENIIGAELSWWNPLSIWYGFKIRLTNSSIYSRILWGIYYLFIVYYICLVSFINGPFFYVGHFLLIFYSLPRWYKKNTKLIC